MPTGVYKRTEKTILKMKKAKTGENNPLYGKKHSLIAKKKMSDTLKGRELSKEHKRNIGKSLEGKNVGEKSHFWKGGISYLPYSVDWTDDLKRSIRKRDRYTCQICGKEPAVEVHHIDYDKKNCNPDNLITLCKSCHGKTNHNRSYWVKLFSSV